MKLVATALAAVQAGSPAFREVKQLYENFQVCGSVHGTVGQNTTFTDSHELAPGETCVYRIKGDGEHPIEIVDFDFDIDCADGEVYFVTDDQMIGPFCNDDHIKRRRRNAYGHSHNDMQGQSFKSKKWTWSLAMVNERDSDLDLTSNSNSYPVSPWPVAAEASAHSRASKAPMPPSMLNTPTMTTPTPSSPS